MTFALPSPMLCVSFFLLLSPAGCADQKQKAELLVRDAAVLREQGNHQGALKIMDQAVSLYPAQAEAHHGRGLSQSAIGRIEESVTALETAVRLKPGWAEAWLALGNSQRQLGEASAAIRSFGEALKINPAFSAARFDRACTQIDLKELTLALKDLDTLIQQNPLHTQARLKRAECVWMTHPEQAIDDLNFLLEREGPNAAARLLRGSAWAVAGNSERAIADMDVACQMQPDLLQARLERGRLLRKMQKEAEARSDFEQAVKLSPENPEALCELSQALRASGNLPEADRLLRKALEIQPNHIQSRITEAELLAAQTNPAGAAEKLRLLTLDPQLASPENESQMSAVRVLLAGYLSRLERAEEAVAELQAVLVRHPDHADARSLQAELLKSLNRTEEAIGEYSHLLAQRRDDPKPLLARATLHAEAGRAVAALQDLNALIDRNPGNADALAVRASVYESQGSTEQAVRDLSEAIRAAKEPWAYHARRGHLLESLGRHEEACSDFTKVVQNSKPTPDVLLALVRILQKKGDEAGALKVLELSSASFEKEMTFELRILYIQLLLDARRTTDAAQQFSRMTAAEQESPAVLLYRAQAELAVGNPANAVRLLKSTEPDQHSKLSRTLLAKALIQSGAPQDAANVLNSLIEESGNDVPLRTLRLQALVLLEDWKAAGDDAAIVIQQDPSSVDAQQVRGILSAMRGDYATALRDLEYDTVRRRNSPDLIWSRIQSLAATGRMDDAHAELTELVEIAPDHVPARMFRATLAMQKADYRQASEDLSRILKKEPANTDALLKRAVLLMRVSRVQSAVSDLTQAIRLNPGLADAWLCRGQARLQLRQFSSALEDLKQCLKLRPDDPVALAAMARMAAENKKPEESIRLYDQLLARHPDNSVAWHNRGIVLFQLKRTEDAVESWSRAIELQPSETKSLSNRAAALLLLKRDQEAANDYRQLVQRTPDNATAWQHYAGLLISSSETSVRNPEMAVFAARKACELSKYRDWRNVNTLARAYEAAGSLKEAKNWAEKSRSLAPSSYRATPEQLVRSLEARLNAQSAPPRTAGTTTRTGGVRRF